MLVKKCGSSTWDRTTDQQINSLLLYLWAIKELCMVDYLDTRCTDCTLTYYTGPGQGRGTVFQESKNLHWVCFCQVTAQWYSMNLRMKKHTMRFPGPFSVGCLKWVSFHITVLTHTHHSTTLVINYGCYLVSFRHLIIITVRLWLFNISFFTVFGWFLKVLGFHHNSLGLASMYSALCRFTTGKGVKLTTPTFSVFILSIIALIAWHFVLLIVCHGKNREQPVQGPLLQLELQKPSRCHAHVHHQR